MERTEYTSNFKGGVKAYACLKSLGRIPEMCKKLPSEYRPRFNQKYGRLLDLLSIQVEENALIALAQYWNSSLRYFEFPTFDVTPTIEEYACMLEIPMQKGDVYYFPADQPLSESKIREQFQELLGLSEKQSKMSGHAGSRGLNRSCLEDRMTGLAQENDWESFSKVLALAIYGLTAPDKIDMDAMDVYYSVEKKTRNPVPAILAETFLTLTRNKSGAIGIIVRDIKWIFLVGISYLVTEDDATKDHVNVTSGYVETKWLILSARYCVVKGYNSVRTFTDYQTIISTIYPKYPTRYHQQIPFVLELKEIVEPFPCAEFLWIRSGDNSPAHEVAKARYKVQTEQERIVKFFDKDLGELRRRYWGDLKNFGKFLKDETSYRK